MLNIKPAHRITVAHPVLAVHGSAGRGNHWNSLERHCLYPQGFHAPDVAGYGTAASCPRYRAERSLASRVAPLAEWVRKQSQPAHIVAHSFGSNLALEVTRALPGQVRSVTLYEPVIPAILRPRSGETDQRLLAELTRLARIVGSTGGEFGMASFMNFWSGCDAWSRFSSTTRCALAAQSQTVHEDFCQAIAMDPYSFETLPRDVPVSIITGADTIPIAQRMSDLLHACLPGSRHTEIPGLGHMGLFLAPDSVNPVIADFIGDNH